MILSTHAVPAARLRGLLALLLLALCLLAAVSVMQFRQVQAQHVVFDEVVLPTLKQVHGLSTQVDALRGLAALHVLQRSDAERAAVEQRLQAGRRMIEQRMAAYGRRLTDDTDRQHYLAVQASLDRYLAAQDLLLAASRRTGKDPDAAARARSLLAGESQQAYTRLRADLDAWWAYTEQSAEQAARQARAAAHTGLLLSWAALALASGSLLGLMAWPRRQPTPASRHPSSNSPLDGPALLQHLQTLNAAVAAARRGEPGRAAGLSAQEAQRLADAVDGAAQRLRLLMARPAGVPQPAADATPHGAADNAPR